MAVKIIKAWWCDSNAIAFVLNKDISFIPDVEISGGRFLQKFKVSRAEPKKIAEQTSYYISDSKIHFLLNDKNFQNLRKVGREDYYVCGSFNGWQKAIGDPKWLMKPSYGVFDRKLVIDVSQLNLKRLGHFKFAGSDGRWLEPIASLPNIDHDKHGISNLRLNLAKTGLHVFRITFDSICSLSDNIKVKLPQFDLEFDIAAAHLLLRQQSDRKLGTYFKNNRTYFSIFAPRAKSAYIKWFNEGDKTERIVEALEKDGSVWTASVFGNLSNARYFWHLDGINYDNSTAFDIHAKIADPYANAMLTSDGPSIVKFDEDLPTVNDGFTPPSWHNLVIMEAHVRDLLANANIDITDDERLSFAGLTKWLADENCYIRKTGVNCVELQPIQEFTAQKRTDYEWGYMPVNWFAPASSYATDAKKATQNDDFADLVKAFHKAGIAVILDVVYNHVGEPNFIIHADKEYYFETNMNCDLMNFSGCGNDFRANAPMAKRMIIDSLVKLVKHYNVDGFRFDLAELLGVEVLEEIEIELKKVKKSIILIAEPWSFRGHIAAAMKDTGYASWNDGFREFMRSYAVGFGNYDGFKYFISGSCDMASFAAQTVNYMESHDDMLLFDRLTKLYDYPSVDDLSRYKICQALMLTSIGIPMLLEGFDIVHTKYGKNNTYKDGQANAIDYSRGLRFSGIANWLRDFVKFRLSDLGASLRCDGRVDSRYLYFYEVANSTAAAVMFNADKSKKSKRIIVAFNPTVDSVELPVPAHLSRDFIHIADIDRFDINGLESVVDVMNTDTIYMPRVSFNMWIER